MMLAAALPLLALWITSIHARALASDGGVNVLDTSSTGPAGQVASQVPESPGTDATVLQDLNSSTSGNTTVIPDGALPAAVQGNSSSSLNLNRPDPRYYPVPGTQITVMLASLGVPLPSVKADEALEAVLDRLSLEIRTSGDQWMPRVYQFTQNGIDIRGLHPFRSQATLRDLEFGITGVQDLMELTPDEGGIGFVTADFSFAKEGRGVIGRIIVKPEGVGAPAEAAVETS